MKKSIRYKLREILIFSLLILFIVIGIINYNYHFDDRRFILFISQLENYVSLYAIYYIWINDFKKRSLYHLITIQKIFLYTMVSVSVLTVASKIFLFRIPIIFHSGVITQRPDMYGQSLIDVTIASGRDPGVFGQVFEAGVAYSIAFLTIIMIRGYFSNRFIFIGSILLIIIGGLISGSKIFIITMIFIVAFISLRNRKIFLLSLVSILSLLAYIYSHNLELPWQFKRLITQITWSNFFHIYTSFRFYDESLIVSGMQKILVDNPMGLGFGFLDNSDFSLYEVLSISGVLGILIYVAVVILMYFNGISKAQLALSFFIIFFLSTASIAAPVITANKVGFIIIMSFLSLKRVVSKI